MQTLTLIAPSHWASYLVNGDASGLERNEVRCADAWLASRGVAHVLDCEDYGFTSRHDAQRYCPGGADCQSYTVAI